MQSRFLPELMPHGFTTSQSFYNNTLVSFNSSPLLVIVFAGTAIQVNVGWFTPPNAWGIPPLRKGNSTFDRPSLTDLDYRKDISVIRCTSRQYEGLIYVQANGPLPKFQRPLLSVGRVSQECERRETRRAESRDLTLPSVPCAPPPSPGSPRLPDSWPRNASCRPVPPSVGTAGPSP